MAVLVRGHQSAARLPRRRAQSIRSSALARLGGVPLTVSSDMPASINRRRRSASPGSWIRLFAFFRLHQSVPAIEPPKRKLGMDLVNARRAIRVRAQKLVHLSDFRRDVEQLFRHFARRVGRAERKRAGFAIIGGINRRPRRAPKIPMTGACPAAAGPFFQPPARRRRSVPAIRSGMSEPPRQLRALRGRHDLGKSRHHPHARFVSARPDERDQPSGRTAVRAREPYVVNAQIEPFMKRPIAACTDPACGR